MSGIKKSWEVYCRYDTHTPAMSFKRMFAGPNFITKPGDARRILRGRGMITFDAQGAVDAGLVPFDEVKAMGFDVVDPGAVELVQEEVIPDGVQVVEDKNPIFSRMTKGEMREKAEMLSDLGIDAELKARDDHDEMVEKMKYAWELAVEEGKIQ